MWINTLFLDLTNPEAVAQRCPVKELRKTHRKTPMPGLALQFY